MSKSRVQSLEKEFEKLTFVGNRTPESSGEDLDVAFAELAAYRNGAIFIGHYAGDSKWERHPHGDEIVFVVEGETTLILLTDEGEVANRVQAGELMVVPENSWHRFETADGVKILTVTPQPTEHSVGQPDG